VRGVGFIDAGNVFATPSQLSLRSLPVSPGVGLRLMTPFGILRMDYGKRWSGEPGRWTFGIGQIF
jgi:outer membrane protein assembly factor BamA